MNHFTKSDFGMLPTKYRVEAFIIASGSNTIYTLNRGSYLIEFKE